MSIYQVAEVDDLDEEAFDTDSEEEQIGEPRNAEFFPRIQLLPEEEKELGQIDELEEELAPPTTKAMTTKQAQRLSKFFDPSMFVGLADFITKGILAFLNIQVNFLLENSPGGKGQAQTENKPEVYRILLKL